jgi:signal transduction histidine kinase
MRGRRADGSEFPLELAIVRVDVPGEPLFTGYLRDVTERVEAARRLAAAEQQRNEVLAELMAASEEERSNIAVELHDDTIQVMTATLLSIDRLLRALEQDQHERAMRAATSARKALGAAVERTRRLMFELRPPLLIEQGLSAALRDVAEQEESDTGIRADVDVEVGRYPDATESLVYRTVLEAVVNVRKHAEAGRLWLRLRERDGEIHGEVRDDGRGFDPSAARDGRRRRLHFGLDAAGERCRLAGGELEVRSGPGEGTCIRFRVPIMADPHRAGSPLAAAVGSRSRG